MQVAIRTKIPFIFLVSISLFWAFFYQSSTWINDYGTSKSEWLLIVDGLIVLPILCFIFIEDKKEALIKSITYSCLIVLLGSLVIPDSSKFVWSYLESGRYALIVLFLVVEIITISTVIFAIRVSLGKSMDPDLSISAPIEKLLGTTILSKILSFDTRLWTYFLFSKRIQKENFRGEKHFTYHQKDGAKSFLGAFILLILVEIPLVHLFLHFVWSPMGAGVITILTLMGLVFFIAEHNAVSIRPISILDNKLIIRYGIWNPVDICFNEMKDICKSEGFIRRSSNARRFNLSGVPNVKIGLRSGEEIYLGVDSPVEFIDEIKRLID